MAAGFSSTLQTLPTNAGEPRTAGHANSGLRHELPQKSVSPNTAG